VVYYTPMPLTVTTKPSKTLFKFPEEPGLQALFEAEKLRVTTQRRFWDGFITLAVCLIYVIIGHTFDFDPLDTLRIVMFFLAGSTVARLIDKMRGQRAHEKAHAIWVDLVKDDPSWFPPEQNGPTREP